MGFFFVVGGGCLVFFLFCGFGVFLRCEYRERIFRSQMGTEKLIVLVKT